MTSAVRAAALTNFDLVAGGLGYNVDAGLLGVGLSSRVLREPDWVLPAQKVAVLLEDAARTTGCETIGLRMVQLRKLSNFGAVSLLLAYQATLRDVLVSTIDHLHLLNSSLVLRIEDAAPLVVVHEDIIVHGPARQSIELALGVLYRMCSALMGTHWRPKTMHFVHDAPRDMAVHRQMFSCPVVFNAGFNGLVFRAEDLDVPNPSADPQLVRYAAAMLESMPRLDGARRSNEVRRVVYAMLPTGRATCKSVAHSLGKSLRTLQRELDEEGTSFTEVLSEARQNLARRYVANPHYGLGQVAGLLGYSTHGAFTRWFTMQFGQSPMAWRRASARPGRHHA